MNVLYVVLIGAAFAIIELLIGGTRLLFSLPAYGVLALAALVSLRDLRRPKVGPDLFCLAASALFFGYILARTLTSPVAYLAWEDRFMVVGGLIVYLLTACYLTDARRRVWVLAMLLALAITNLVVGARQFSAGDGFMLFGFLRPPQYLGRASGLYICPDHLAGFLETVGCLGLSVALWSRLRGWAKVLFGYGALMCFAGLIITGSRGGFVSATAGLAVWTLLSLGRLRTTAPHWLGRAVLALLAVLGLAAGTLAYVIPRSTVLESRASAVVAIRQDARPLLWEAALEQAKLAPLVGTGSATYLYYGRMFRHPRLQLDPIRPHCDYLELLAEYGWLGVAGCAFFLAVHLWRGWRSYQQLSLRSEGMGTVAPGSNVAAWNIGALAAVTCLLVHSTVDFNLHIPANTLLLAFVFGVLANPGRALGPAGDGVARVRPVDLLPRLALPALGVWIAVSGLPKLPGEYYAEKARVALRDGHTVAALGFALHGLEHEHANPNLYFYLGQARQNLSGNGPDEPVARSFRLAASEAYRAGLRLAPMDIYLLVHEGEVLTRLGDFAGAEEIFRQVEKDDPRSGYTATYYGFYLQNRGLLPEAEAAYRQAANAYPNETATRSLSEIERVRAAGVRTAQ